MFKATLICFCAWISFSYSQYRIEGVVTDNGAEYLGGGAEPVADVLVEVTNEAEPSRQFSGVTDSGGRYSIEITETGVGEATSGTPAAFGLSQNYPNPFNPSTVITYQLSRPSEIRIDVHDLLGRRIRTLLNGFTSEKNGRVVWDGTDESGRCVPAGVYVYSLTSQGTCVSRKMLLIDGGMSTSYKQQLRRNSSPRKQDRALSDRYRIRFSGPDIESLIHTNMLISGPTVLDVTANRTVADMDGNVYRTVKIGNQWWTAENIRTEHYRNGDPIPNVTDNSSWGALSTGAYCDYDNNTSVASTYGHLYNWYAVTDSRDFAPAGWHVPTDTEWQTLVEYLGGWLVAGGKMKEDGTTHWTSPNIGATNESGFSALPGCGRNYDGSLDSMGILGMEARFWSASEGGPDGAWERGLGFDHSGVSRYYYHNRHGFSVRLIRD